MRAVRRRIRWSRVLLLLIIFLLFIFGVTRATIYTYKAVFKTSSATLQNIQMPQKDYNRINILLLGLDDGDESNPESPRRSDTMILASINKEDGSVSLLSIPRDTRVLIPGHKDFDKIAHAYFYGGPQLAVRTVENFLQQPVHHYIALNWQTFIRLVDVVGGVNLYVERDMHYHDPYANLNISLQKGYQRLDGHKAGEYVRFRSDELGDIGRVQRQQKFIKAWCNEALNSGIIFKISEIIKIAEENIQTDMPATEIIKVAYNIKWLTVSNVHIEMLPGRFATVGGLSYWAPDTEQVAKVVNRMFSVHSAEMSGAFDKNKRSN